MNKILSTVLISAIASSVTLSAATTVNDDTPEANRHSSLFINPLAAPIDYNGTNPLSTPNEGNYDTNVSVDFATPSATPVQIVWNSFVNLTSGSKFTLRTNANFALSPDVVLCTNDGAGSKQVGRMVSVGDTDGSTIMNNMSFRIADDTGSTLADAFIRENNVTFVTGTDCSTGTPLSVVAKDSKACQTINIEIPQAIDDSSQSFDDYTANPINVALTKRMVRVACTVPVCTIDSAKESKLFTLIPSATGVNKAITSVIASGTASTYCPECDEATNASCTTIITVTNTSPDFNITSLSVTPSFTDGLNADMGVLLGANVTGSLTVTESNTSSALGTSLAIGDLNITGGTDHNITIVYTPATNAVIKEGMVTGDLVFTSNTGAVLLTDREASEYALAKFATAGQTQFTVPYMNTAYKSMVKVTNLSDEAAVISAIITDQDGTATPSIDLGTIAGNATGFYFSTQGVLRDGADATVGLKGAWSVVFTVNAAVTAVATMVGPDGGDRAISVF